jgi:signal transduction histidine kinase
MKNKKIKILHLEDLLSDAEQVEREIKKSGINYEIVVAKNRKEFTKALHNLSPDIILSDHSLPSFDSISALKILRESGLGIPFILVTSTMPDEGAAQVMKEGADDYILKDRLSRLPIAIVNTIEKFRLAQTAVKLENDIAAKEMQIANAIVEAKELERTELGKELHDNVSQLLGAAKLYIDMAKKDTENRDRFLLESSVHTLKALEEIKKLSKGLVTSITEKMGICEVIENVINDIKGAYQIAITFTHTEVGEIGEKLSLNIYRIVQEQLNNILKHANASDVIIDLSQTKSGLTLIISDNGNGFDTSKKYKGIGITNIMSRAELYKGTANFISEAGKGCKLIVTFPLQQTFEQGNEN